MNFLLFRLLRLVVLDIFFRTDSGFCNFCGRAPRPSLPTRLATASPSVRARALLDGQSRHEARLLALDAHVGHVVAVLLRRFLGGRPAPTTTLQMATYSFKGRPEPQAELSQVKGAAVAGIARMLVYLFERRIRSARAERAGRGLQSVLPWLTGVCPLEHTGVLHASILTKVGFDSLR